MSLESFRIQPLRLDHIDAHIPDRLIAHELDSAGRILRVQLTDGGDVRDTSGASLSLAWKHQRGASGLEPFSVVDAATGVYEVTYPSAMMLDGVATCSIQVAEGSSVAATRNFHVRIQDAPIDGDTTASTETWTALQLILTQGQTAVTALEEQHTEHATAHSTQMQQQASDWQAQTASQASAHDTQMQQQSSEFSTAQSTRADEFTDALTDYQAQVDAAAASATEVYIGTGTPPENAVLWIDTTDGGRRVKSLINNVWRDVGQSQYIGDTRSGDYPPSHYITHFPQQVIYEIKLINVVSLPWNANTGGDTGHAVVQTITPWRDTTGGTPTQTVVGKKMYTRYATSETTWSAWEQVGV